MKFTILKLCFVVFIAALLHLTVAAQNSVLVNFGSNFCGTDVPSYSIIRNPLSETPLLTANCDFSAQQPTVFSVFIAYNPRNNKIYIADIRSGDTTKIWLLDAGLPGNINCPPIIPVEPTYSYPYVANNFEFDNNGNLWAFSNYKDTAGECLIDNFDVNTGSVLSSKRLLFPAGDFPTTIQSGDLTILPNGRMFACLGTGVCRLYEITGYNTNAPVATAQLLQLLPKDCYGIAYLNGTLELTGFDDNGCYYYDYDISNNSLGVEKSFQNGQLPIDNTSFTPAVGITKKLVSAVKVNNNTADLVYEIYVANMGNTIVNNIGVTDDLAAVFGNGNISNVTASFVNGSNIANLTINPGFNGTSVTGLLNAGQQLPNQILTNQDYHFSVRVSCRVTNLNTTTTYLNSAIVTGDIGNAATLTLVPVSDSSNNGESTVIDPNNNGNPSDVNENIPTPFVFGALPVKFIDVTASQVSSTSALIKWRIATPTDNAAKFEIEFTIDDRIWSKAGEVLINDQNQSSYQFSHTNISHGNIFYRIKEIDKDGSVTYSKIVLLQTKNSTLKLAVYPNPAQDYIKIIAADLANKKITLMDATGRKLAEKKSIDLITLINTSSYPNGSYLLQVKSDVSISSYRIIIHH